jgi:proteasome lid subunit RPN8/RPN11
MKTATVMPKTGPDVKELGGRELPRSAFPGRGASEFRVFLDAAVHEQIRRHAQEDVTVEICGVLVGSWQRDDDGPYVAVNAAIPGEAVANKLSEVTFTHETWAKIHKRMDAEFADRSIVGWYHTHPDFGIFLSERDCFIHEHFFREPGQVAYVVDPIRNEEGFFTWSAGKPAPAPHYWVGQRLRVAPPIASDREERRDRRTGSSGNAAETSRKPAAAAASDAALPPAYSWVNGALLGTCLFLLGFMIARHFGTVNEELNLSRFALMKSLKPGLGTSLADLSQSLGALSAGSAQIADIAATISPANSKALWTQAATRTAELQRAIDNIRAVYALSPEEEEMLQKWNLSVLRMPQATSGAKLAPATTQSATAPTTNAAPGAPPTTQKSN